MGSGESIKNLKKRVFPRFCLALANLSDFRDSGDNDSLIVRFNRSKREVLNLTPSNMLNLELVLQQILLAASLEKRMMSPTQQALVFG